MQAAGWSHGQAFKATFSEGAVVYEKAEGAPRKVAGSQSRPIIDTNTDKLKKSLGGAAKVNIKAKGNRIIITALVAAIASILFNFYPQHAKAVLIGCECSGQVRRAFEAAGHYALSADLKPCTDGGNHYQGNMLDVVNQGWDVGIFHPNCQFLCCAGMHRTTRGLRPMSATDEAAEFFMACFNAPIGKVAVENPVGVMSTRFRKADQYVQPYQFGSDASKNTGLWLRGLPKLVADPAEYVAPRIVVAMNGKKYNRWGNQTDSGQNCLPPSATRSAERSVTYPGIAAAMAAQWGI